jgi:DNA polymerase elongation subunit (family B)
LRRLTSQSNLERLAKIVSEVKQRLLLFLGYRYGLQSADVRELAIRRRVGRLSYSRKCAEASAVKPHLKQGIPLAPGMEIGYVVKDAGRWEVEPERMASGFDAGYYGKLLEKAWEEAAFVFLERKS